MIAPTEEKKEYLETMREEQVSEGSYANNLLFILDDSSEFRKNLVKSQWQYAKKQLKENESPRTLTEAGDLYLLRNNYKRAIRDYQKSLILDSNYIPAYEKIIMAYSSRKQHPKALPYFEELLKLTNNREEIYRKYAFFMADMVYYHGGEIKRTLEVINKVLNLNPNDFELINVVGFIKLNFEKDIKVAEEYFTKALGINKDYIHSLNNKAVCLLRKEELSEAEEVLLKCIKIAPKNYPFSHQNLALLYVRKNNFSTALDILREGEANNVRIENPWQHLIGWLLIQNNKFEEAVKWYESKTKDEPNNQLLINNLGFCYSMLGNKDLAENKFREAVNMTERGIKNSGKLDIRSMKAYYNLGRSLLMRRNLKETEKISRRIKEIKGIHKDAFALYLDGAIKNLQGEYEEAKKVFRECLSIDDKIPEIYPDYAFILESIDKNYTEAIELLEKAIKLGFGQILIYNNLAFSYIKMGEIKKAEKILSQFDVKNSENVHPIILATSGLLEIRKGNLEKGNEFYKKAIKLFSGENSKIAKQIQYLENAKYFLEKGENDKVVKIIDELKQLPESYVTKDIIAFEEKFKKLKN